MDFMLDVDNVERSSLRIVVDPTTFSSGNGIRDTNARRTVFETRQFPEIIFDLQTVNSSAATLADGGTVDLTLQGELAMHGVTNPLEIPASLTRLGNKVTAQGQFEVSLTSFEMSRPSFLVWTIDDIVIIRFTISGSF